LNVDVFQHLVSISFVEIINTVQIISATYVNPSIVRS